MRTLCLLAALFAGTAHAYDLQQLNEDCRAQELRIGDDKPLIDIPKQTQSDRCLAYIRGVVDGYEIADRLAGKVGVQLNAFCLPKDPEIDFRLTRAVVIQLERMPPLSTVSAATLVAGSLAKAFPCPETLEQKK